MSEPPDETRRFACSASPPRRAGRRRLALILATLTIAAIGAAALAWTTHRTVPAVLALGVALLPVLAWRMSGDLDPLELWLADGRLTVRTRRHLLRWPAAGASGRRLGADEIAHVAGLSQTAGFLTSASGFDSHRLGEFELYASDLANAVLIDLGDDRLVVTPDDPDRFLHTLHDG